MHNTIGTNSSYSAISGGTNNNIADNAPYRGIQGGYGNKIGTNSGYSVIGGGFFNVIASNVLTATIPGGNQNFATNSAFAAGSFARAIHPGSFVWGDSFPAFVLSAAADSVTMRASGGYRLFSNGGATAGVSLAAGGGSWTSISDRNAKENFAPVNAREVLEKVASLPLSTWNYKSQAPAIRHIGPMAQDFKAAFGLGESDTGITGVDADGVALAAIQGLNQKLEQKETEITELKTDNEELKKRLEALERQLSRLGVAEKGGER